MFKHMEWHGSRVASLVNILRVPGETGRVPNTLGDFLGEVTSLVVLMASGLEKEDVAIPVVCGIGDVNSMDCPGCSAFSSE